MEAFDCLPPDLRDFVRNLDFNLLDDHILAGEAEIRYVRRLIEAGHKPRFYETGKN